MEETFEDRFKAALCNYVNRQGKDAVEVTSYDQTIRNASSCETCGPDYDVEVDIYFVNLAGKSSYYTYYGEFGQLIRELTD